MGLPIESAPFDPELTPSEFTDVLRAELAILEDVQNRMSRDIGRLLGEFSALTDRWARIHSALEAALRSVGMEPAPPSKNQGPDLPPIWVGARDALAYFDQPMTAAEILRALESQGWSFTTPNAREVVRGILTRKPGVFVKLPDGRFGLRTNATNVGARGEEHQVALWDPDA